MRGNETSDGLRLPRYRYVLARVLVSTVPALLSLTLVLGASAATNSLAADFSSVVPFELGEGEFFPGDSITIQRVTGTSPTIRTGETYCVEGTYTLTSHDKAHLALYATAQSSVPTPNDPGQTTLIEKGTGTFRLVKTMREEGYLHVSLYPVPGGSSFGGIYFGQGEWVNHDKGWTHLDSHPRVRDYVGTENSTGGPVSLTGPNQALLEFLGDPVAPPADMAAAYSKDGLIKAIQTAARNAGISVKRVEVDDSEYPFLLGIICQEGDYRKLTDQLRKMQAYEYNGCISSSTHSALNLVPHRAFPRAVIQRIDHRTGLREQVLFDKIIRLK